MRINTLTIFFVALMSFGTMGCATFGDLERGLNSLVGEDINTASSILGYPDGKMDFQGQTIYSWNTNRAGSYYLPQTAYTTGYVGNTAYSSQTNYGQVVSYQQQCEIRLSCDSSDRVTSWQYDGNISGCEGYIDRLQQFANQRKRADYSSCSTECSDLYEKGSLQNGETAESCVRKLCS